MQQIEYKYSSEISVYFYPIENGKCEYYCQVHDFGNLDMFDYGRVSYQELQDILKYPTSYAKHFRG